MILGIGTDILKIERLRSLRNIEGDPFIRKTFTEKEREQAAIRPDSVLYYATRFAGKEAVFKSLGTDADAVKLNEIEILSKETGRPEVTLLGGLNEMAIKKGIKSIQISLSYEADYAIAFAIAQD